MTLKWKKRFLNIAKEVSTYSTCSRMHVGAILVKENRIISMGYNGVPSGQIHCIDNLKKEFLRAFNNLNSVIVINQQTQDCEIMVEMYETKICIKMYDNKSLVEKNVALHEYLQTMTNNRILHSWNPVTPCAADNLFDWDYIVGQIVVTEPFKRWHGEWSRLNELHSESNAILAAAQNGISTKETDLFLTLSPCVDCAKQILSAGIKNVYYSKKYDRDVNGIEYLKKAGVNIEQVIDEKN